MKGGNTLLLDRNGMIWQACMGDSLNHIPGGLVCIDPVTFEVKSVWNTPGSVSSLCMNSARDRLFFLSKDVYTTEISVIRPACIFNSQGRQFYGLDYDPELDELYVANARDFVSHGMAYRLKAGSGLMVDSFDTGIIPNGFYFLP
jgi:sugar lactone lactonase YvrE